MPYLAPRICACGNKVPNSQRCQCQIKREKERNARYEAKRPSARERGYDSKWDKARAGFLAKHPNCAKCNQLATVVDHIIPHKGDKALFWQRSNWQPLCAHCHSSHKQREENK